jgi:hypothetical protein
MKRQFYLLLLGYIVASLPLRALNVPSDGSDGALSPTNDIVVDLSLAPTGAWESQNSANSGKGVYDPKKWAVVFKYSSVSIPSGVKVSFINHPSRAPVVWLVSGDVVINGTVDVAGHPPGYDTVSQLVPAEPGPGGFRGGPRGPLGFGAGYGPGGDGGTYSQTYGNPQIIPLIGGSGATPYFDLGRPRHAGGGGGAIMIAAARAFSLGGLIDANGGTGSVNGSGGAVRVIAEQVSGEGSITALADGRVRIETRSLAQTVRTFPETVAVAPQESPILWLPDNAPLVRVVSVDGQVSPVDPTAPLLSSADVGIQNNSVVQVILETTNFPIEGVVQLRVVQKYGPATWVQAARLDGGFASARWVANLAFAPGFSTLQARATVP